MRQLKESDKLKISDIFCKTLVKYLIGDESGKQNITDEEKTQVFDDIQTLRSFTNGQMWQEIVSELKVNEKVEGIRDKIENAIVNGINDILITKTVKDWVLLHIQEDFLNVLEVSVRRFQHYIMPIVIEVPQYLNLNEEFYNKIAGEEIKGKMGNLLVSRILKKLPDKYKAKDKVILINYNINNYRGEDTPEKIIEVNNEFGAKILKPF